MISPWVSTFCPHPSWTAFPGTSQCAQWQVVWHQEDRPSKEEGDWDRLETDLGSSLQGVLGSQRPQERSRSGVSIDSGWTCPLGPQTLYIVKRDSQTEPSEGQDREPLLLSLKAVLEAHAHRVEGKGMLISISFSTPEGSRCPAWTAAPTSRYPCRVRSFLAAAYIHAERCPSS